VLYYRLADPTDIRGLMFSLLLAALKFVLTAKFGAGLVVGSLFVPSTTLRSAFARAVAWVKTKAA